MKIGRKVKEIKTQDLNTKNNGKIMKFIQAEKMRVTWVNWQDDQDMMVFNHLVKFYEN